MPAIDNAHALVIGIADYANIRKLPKVQDAQDLAAALVDSTLCGYDPKNVTVLLDQDATKDKLRTGLDALKDRCNADSTVFLYFSGHGGQIKTGRTRGNTFCPSRWFTWGMKTWRARPSRGRSLPPRSTPSRPSG